MTLEEALKVLRAEPGDVKAWDVLATGVYHPLLAYASSLLLTFRVAPGETAHDIVHTILIAFHERWPSISAQIVSEGELQAYLRRSCRNLLIDKYRRHRHAGMMVDFLELNFSRAFENQKDPDRAILVDEIIGALSPDCAKLFTRYVEEDLSLAEIAEQSGLSPAAFYSRWYRCVQRAKEIFMKRKDGSRR